MENIRQRFVKSQLRESAAVKNACAENLPAAIESAALLMAEALKGGGKIMFCGNGGSAADSQHLATEIVVRLSGSFDRPALPALALTTDSSILTAAGNDFGFETIFSRQVEALAGAADLLIAISTSGNSANVIKAVESARKLNIRCIALLGQDGGKLKSIADIALCVPSTDVQRIQEAHIAIGHVLIGLVEMELFNR